ncbi:MAG TPA: LpxI family protein, partial [Micropepsaceae bacterium]|nr:LpxI family protein [Micropepsaceae bacterium]
VMRVVVDHIASWGVTVVRPEEIITSLRAQKGVITHARPGEAAMTDIARGLKLLRTLGEFDFGQGCVVCDGYVLAVEAAEGTDGMLSRVAGLPENLRGVASARRGVLIKAAKPQQDRRFDLPTIGRHTVEGAAAAGLAGIAVEAGQALIVGREEVAALADRLGLFIAAVDGEGHVA